MKIWQILDPNLDQSFSILTSRSIEAVAGALGIQNGQAAASLAIAEKWDFNLAQLIITVIFTATTIITIITIIIISIILLIREGRGVLNVVNDACLPFYVFLQLLCHPPLSLNPFYLESKYFTKDQNIWYKNIYTNIYTIQLHTNAYNIFTTMYKISSKYSSSKSLAF